MDLPEVTHRLLAVARQAAEVREATRAAVEGMDFGAGVYVLAVGKASVEMAESACGVLAQRGVRVLGGVVTAVPERVLTGVSLPAVLEVLPADHPLPTMRNVRAAEQVRSLVTPLRDGDQLLVLMSGGASAHLTWPAEGVTLEDVRDVTLALQKSGAEIGALNAVRKHLERLKGGRLGAACHAGRTDVLVVSDVIGDRLDVIGSGPMACDESTFGDALRVLESLGDQRAPAAVLSHLRAGARGALDETPKPGDPRLARISHRVIASNAMVVDAVAREARVLGVHVAHVERGVTGEARDAGRMLAERLLACEQRGTVMALMGGEPTVTVARASRGKGGPSQEVALAAAVTLAREGGCSRGRAMVTAYSTDGIDGPTDAAGAVIDVSLLPADYVSRGERALAESDSYAALDEIGALLRTGPSGTNVNHVAWALRGW